MRRIVRTAGAMCVLVVATGCSSRLKETNSALRAENADLRSRTEQLNDQYTQIASENDRAQADLARRQAEIADANARSNAMMSQNAQLTQQSALAQQQNAQYQADMVRLQQDLASAEVRARDAQAKLDKNVTGDMVRRQGSPQLEAFRADLQARLARYHVTGVDVDIRTAQDGQQRVALVLQNAFRAGSASLTSNPSAVKAIVGLGKLVAESYPGSRVAVEGHTDADQISKSKWSSNEELSLARADEVKKLLRQAGVPDGRVSAVGMGARQPVAKGATARAKAQNRRVELYIYPSST